MFAVQHDMATVVTSLSRPQMAILGFYEKLTCNLRRKRGSCGSLTHEAQEGTRRQPQRTTTQQGRYGARPAQE